MFANSAFCGYIHLMTLKEYITLKGLSAADLARELEVTRAATSFWLNNKRRPSAIMMKRIIQFSDNKVDANSFYQ